MPIEKEKKSEFDEVRVVHSCEEMMQLGKEISQRTSLVLLHGELGVGKTIFTKGFAEGLGINPTLVQSPTYTYLNIYQNLLLHIDLYRLNSFDEVVDKGIFSEIQEAENIVIEWPKWIDKFHFSHYTEVSIEKLSETERKVTIHAFTLSS